MMNDYPLIRELFTQEEIQGYLKIRQFQQNLGNQIEDYLNQHLSKNVQFVGRDKNRPEGVDYIVNDTEYWSVKNAWNTENNSNKRFREDRQINHWYRLNKDGTTNWEQCFVQDVSEKGFIEYITGKTIIGLERFVYD